MKRRFENVDVVEFDVDANGQPSAVIFFRDENLPVRFHVGVRTEMVFTPDLSAKGRAFFGESVICGNVKSAAVMFCGGLQCNNTSQGHLMKHFTDGETISEPCRQCLRLSLREPDVKTS